MKLRSSISQDTSRDSNLKILHTIRRAQAAIGALLISLTIIFQVINKEQTIRKALDLIKPVNRKNQEHHKWSRRSRSNMNAFSVISSMTISCLSMLSRRGSLISQVSFRLCSTGSLEMLSLVAQPKSLLRWKTRPPNLAVLKVVARLRLAVRSWKSHMRGCYTRN